MFLIHVLPAKLTLAALATAVFALTGVASLLGLRPKRSFCVALLLAFLGFIPSCFVVTTLVDRCRFGAFYYPTHQSIDDESVQSFMPNAAREIVVEKRDTGFTARFRIAPSELTKWVDGEWDRHGKFAENKRAEADQAALQRLEAFDLYFGHMGWTAPKKPLAYGSTRSGRYAGWYILYDELEQTAYEWANYW